jgi:hypothetical protein
MNLFKNSNVRFLNRLKIAFPFILNSYINFVFENASIWICNIANNIQQVHI